jgi:hypothetical protein
MLKRIARAFAGAIAGYVIGAILGGALVSLVSTNTFDKEMEVGMTAFFAAGPVGAIVGFLAGLTWRSSSAPTHGSE